METTQDLQTYCAWKSAGFNGHVDNFFLEQKKTTKIFMSEIV